MIANAWVVWLILLLPLGAFLVVGLIGRRVREGGGYLVVGAMAGSLVLSLYIFVQVLSEGGGSREESVFGDPRRRRPLPRRRPHHLERVRHAPVQRDRATRRPVERTTAHPHPAPPVRWRGREVRPVPATHLAPGRDGRPDDGQRLDPCRDHGEGGRLPDGPVVHLPGPTRPGG